MKQQYRRAASILVVTSLAALAACDAGDTRDPSVASLDITSPSLALAAATPETLLVGQTASLVQNSQLAINIAKEGFIGTWKSTVPGVVTIAPDGKVTGVGPGSAKVVVSYKKWVDSIPVSVKSSTGIASLALSASSTSLLVGQTATLAVVARGASGSVIASPSVSYRSSAAAVAAVSSSGIVSALAAGNATITATSGTVSASVNIAVSSVTTSTPTPSTGTVAAPAPPQLLSFSYPRVTGKSWVVQPTDNLQSILNNAQRGDEIVLPAGATFTGNFVLPAKSGTAANGWILVRSNKSLPGPGTRVTPANASLMPRIMTASVAPAIATAPAASGWWISGVEITIAPTLTSINYGLVSLGDGSGKQASLASVPTDLVIERSYVHGQATSNVSRCIALNSARTAIMDAYLHECHLKGYDSQAIAGWNGPGPFKIVNNTLAGAGENLMFGGSDPAIANLIPSDIEIRRNYIYTPASWKGVWTKKNVIESKNSQRVLVEANVIEGSWTDGQVGFAIVLKSANQSGACTWCVTRDWDFRNNIIRNAGAGFNLAGREGSNPYPVGQLLGRVRLEQNLVENINVGIYVGDGKMVQILNNLTDLTLRNNSFTSSGSFSSVVTIGTVPGATNVEMTKNAAHFGAYGIHASGVGGGEAALKTIYGTISYAGQVFVGAVKSGYPRSQFVSSISAVPSGTGASSTGVAAATAGVVIP